MSLVISSKWLTNRGGDGHNLSICPSMSIYINRIMDILKSHKDVDMTTDMFFYPNDNWA